MVMENGKWGYNDKRGEMVIEPQFDKAHFFRDGQAKVWIDERSTIIDRTGKQLEPLRSLTK